MRSVVSTVLVVHADTRLCELLQLALGNAGYDVCVAMDADDAMSQFRRHSPDLVILDLAIAARSGADFCRLLKGKSAGRAIPVFALSESSPASAYPQGLEIGAEECFTRPFAAPELIMKVKRSLERLEEHRKLQGACTELEKSARKLQAELDLCRRELTGERSGVQSVMDFNQRIDPTLDHEDIGRRGLLQSAALFRVTGACLFQTSSSEAGWVVPDRWHGVVEDRVRGLRLPRSGEFLRILSAAARPLRLEDFERVPGTSWEAGILAAAGFTVVAPLLVRGELSGVLAITDRAGADPFLASDMELLGLFSSSLAQVLEAARSRESDRTLMTACVRVLVERFEEDHPFLAGHSHRVAEMCEKLGRRLGLSRRDLDSLVVAGLLHDIGMHGIDPEVLARPGPLTPEEVAHVRKHPARGADLALEAGLPDEIRSAILHHHENWNGTGYPTGIGSRDIPLFARILAVAECHDAMSSRRPWRGPLPDEDIELYLASESGLRYDPRVVDAMLSLVSSMPDLDVANG